MKKLILALGISVLGMSGLPLIGAVQSAEDLSARRQQEEQKRADEVNKLIESIQKGDTALGQKLLQEAMLHRLQKEHPELYRRVQTALKMEASQDRLSGVDPAAQCDYWAQECDAGE
jgi:hypothetical protein